MSEKGWLRKRPLRESSPNLLPLHQSNKTNTTAFRPAASSSAFSVQCYEALSGKPPLQSSSQQKYHHEREHNRGTYPTRLSKSFSLSSLVGMTTQQSNSGEACIPNIRSNSSETSLCHPSIATGQKTSPTRLTRHSKTRKWHASFYQTKLVPYLERIVRLSVQIFIQLIHIRPTQTQIIALVFLQMLIYIQYHISHRLEWERNLEWTTWEQNVQDAIRQSIPPPPLNRTLTKRFSHLDNLILFPNLQLDNTSEYIVPVPDYKEMALVRGKLASQLKRDSSNICHVIQQQNITQEQSAPISQTKHVLPVMGITVANDTPENRYFRRILHTVDFNAVGTIVVTWYDEHTQAQLLNDEPGLSHQVIEDALNEFIDRFGFIEVDWSRPSMKRSNDESVEDTSTSEVKLASSTSLHLLSRTTTSIHQFCRFETKYSPQQISRCQNELLILRFPTNLGCSTGVNNPLFTHPTAPYWLIANYDIAYPPGTLFNIGLSVQNTLHRMPNLAVHTFGYIYGRGQLENPWSNFVMTSCAVATVGVWDEDIFPAYYEDDDFRDRIRYIMGKWLDDYGLLVQGYEDAPTKRMDDTHLIRYQTDRSVAVAHGPLSADAYISGTHDTMQKVKDEEEKVIERRHSWLHKFLWRTDASTSKIQNPFYYESLRWKTMRELSNTERFFQCKHGNLPNPGEFGDDTLRYFGWTERFLSPFINETRVDRLRRKYENNDRSVIDGIDSTVWSRWSFNATRRQCVHEGSNQLLSLSFTNNMDELEKMRNLTLALQQSCSLC